MGYGVGLYGQREAAQRGGNEARLPRFVREQSLISRKNSAIVTIIQVFIYNFVES